MKRIFTKAFSILLICGMLLTPQFQSVIHIDAQQNTIAGNVSISLESVDGDVNSDGMFNIADVFMLQKILLNVSGTYPVTSSIIDIHKDGKLNVLDLCALKWKMISATDAPQTTTLPTISTTVPPATTTVPLTTPPTTTTYLTTTPPKTTSQTVTTSKATLADTQAEMLSLVNEQRRLSNVPELSSNNLLNQAAQVRAFELVESFSHTRPDGGSCFSILNQLGISFWSCGENIAYNYSAVPANALNQWMNSPPHKANMLSADFTAMGVGFVETVDHRCYWVQIFMS